ncbi:hypothetical protein IFM89_034844 [Coptis chinensis]|uniref:V-type proton ATPase subunit G n=1 Tax=Coptis chinensis TaxID=261450 RepID=A0A835H8X7_9MAGN|nr:hypothetical protein IFM89_034844 [Coptis chinensis]
MPTPSSSNPHSVIVLSAGASNEREVFKFTKQARKHVWLRSARKQFFGKGRSRCERNWFAVNSWNIGTRAGREGKYEICTEFLELASEFYGAAINGEEEENNTMNFEVTSLSFGSTAPRIMLLRVRLHFHFVYIISILFTSVFGFTTAFVGSMESHRGQGGIQLLLAAEQEAQQIVNVARNAKLARLKQAKEEAEKEILNYRTQMEAEFQKKVAASSGDSGANVKRLEVETQSKICHLNSEAERISHDVVDMLLRHVTTVKN